MKVCYNTYRFVIITLCLIVVQQSHGQSFINERAFKTLKIYNEVEVNTANLESSPAFIGDKLAFVYTETKSKLFDKTIDEPSFQLGYSIINEDNSLQPKVPYGKKINSNLHQGPMAYDLEKNQLFFTRSHKERRVRKGITEDTLYLRILSADLNKSNPSPQPIELNIDNYSVCHPALSTDGNTMIFSSNQPGNHGQMDLYTAYFNGEKWTGTVNLGTKINSAHNEIFPYLLNDTILIFASNRPGGFGGLDMYVSFLSAGDWSEPEILPSPINTAYDDLGMIVRSDFKSGYFASNRLGGKGKDDIYRFESDKPIFGDDHPIITDISLSVLDKLMLSPIPKCQVTITPLDININDFNLSGYNISMLEGKDAGDIILKLSPGKGKAFPPFFTDEKGNSEFQINRNLKYLIQVENEDYNPLVMIYDYHAYGSNINLVLEPSDIVEDSPSEGGQESLINDDSVKSDSIVENEIKVGDVLTFNNIYFGYDSSRPEASALSELNTLTSILNKRPEMKIRIESHTDSRGTQAYNLQLSINRANAVRDYLVSKGINEDRLVIKGYGESRLLNHCKDNVPCTEAEHRYNRRTEIVIIGD